MGLSTITPETRSEEFIDRIARAMGSGGTSPLDTIVPETRHEEFIDRIARANGWEDVSPMASIYPETRMEEFLNRIADNAGGGGGLTYETGTITPETDTFDPIINFTDSHDAAPVFCLFQDITNTYCGVKNAALASFIGNYNAFSETAVWGSPVTSEVLQGVVKYRPNDDANYLSNGTVGANISSIDTYMTASFYKPLSNQGKMIAGRTYKWLAVWL